MNILRVYGIQMEHTFSLKSSNVYIIYNLIIFIFKVLIVLSASMNKSFIENDFINMKKLAMYEYVMV